MMIRKYQMQNRSARTFLLPTIYDFHQLIKARDIFMLQTTSQGSKTT
jgi:hypothetical protein